MKHLRKNTLMITELFQITAKILSELARRTKLTYNEINILIYYLVIPLSWTILLDILIGLPVTTIIFIFVWGGILFVKVHNRFREWCDWLFRKSVDFLMYFNRYGSNYVLSSVIFCIVVPVIIYIGLIMLLILINS